jgi:hypothetical protein
MPDLHNLSEQEWQMMRSLALRKAAVAQQTAAQNSAHGKIATLQKDTVTPDDYVDSSYVYGQDDPTLAKAQYARAGSAAPLLFGNTPARTATGFDYSGVTPIKGPDDLLSNPKFVQLARIDPKKADTLYTSFTGRSFAQDMKDKETQKMAMMKDYENGIRSGFISGDLRRNPTMGWLERRRVISNPLDPTEPQKVTWEPVSSEMQQADKDYNKFSTGYQRPNTIIDEVPMSHRDIFLQTFAEQKKLGKTDKEAAKAAASLIAAAPQGPNQLAQLNQRPEPPPPAAVKANPTPPPPAEGDDYQTWATQQATAGPNIFDAMSAAARPVWDYGVKPVGKFIMGLNEGSRIAENAATGVANLPNMLAIKMGAKKPLYPWLRPSTKEEFDKRNEERAARVPVPDNAGAGFTWPADAMVN